MHNQSQATSIRRYQQSRPSRVIAVSSGKGGVGKSNVATNISVAMAEGDRNVMLMDADLSLANIDVLLGLQPRFNLSHVVSGEADLESTIIGGPGGLRIVPASSGNFAMTDLPAASQAAIIQAFGSLAVQPEILVVDTASGISESVARFVQAAQEAVIVVCNEPSSITDAYALIKVFSRNYGITRFQIVTNQTRDEAEGRELYSKLVRVTDRYLDVVLRQLGNVPHDIYLKKAVQEQRAVVEAYPRSSAGQAFKKIAQKLLLSPGRSSASGGIQFFFERLLGSEQLKTRRLA
jgi:flagellar biosynthesis protein FlhG